MKPEDRAALERSWNLEDRERRLKTAEADAEVVAKELAVAKLSLDNGLTKEQRTELAAIDDVNEMRARAAELRSERLTQELEAAKAGTTAATTAGTDPKRAPAGMRGDPAGSGQGGSSGAHDASKFKGTGDVAGFLRSEQGSGAAKYETIPIGGR